MLLDLGSQESARGLDRRLKQYGRAGQLVVDETGYLSYDARNARPLPARRNKRPHVRRHGESRACNVPLAQRLRLD